MSRVMALAVCLGLSFTAVGAEPEVRWRLETAADQPGLPGFEGLPFNERWGWGRLDLQAVFDPLPVLTRLSRYTQLDARLYSGTSQPFESITHSFTTHDSVAWSVSVPTWLQPSQAEGSNGATVDLTLDATNLAPGVYADSYSIVAPAADDAGRKAR